MALTRREKRKLLAGLAAMLDDEERELAKNRRTSTVWQWVGAVLVVGALFAAFQYSWMVLAVAVVGILGGFAAGISLVFGSFVAQWPVLKPLLNPEAVREAHRAEAGS